MKFSKIELYYGKILGPASDWGPAREKCLTTLNAWHTVINGAAINWSLFNVIFFKNCIFGDIT